MKQACIFSIQRASFVDGPGIRTCIFFKGCNLHCIWCHNPESRQQQAQLLYYANRCLDCGRCKAVCPYQVVREDYTVDPTHCKACGLCVKICPGGAREICGKWMREDEVFSEILADKEYYGGEGGATFSGGECLLQLPFLHDILRRCREKGIHTAIDTAGNVPFISLEQVQEDTDLFLYDIKAVTPELHRHLTGVDNARILENYRRLYAKCAHKLWVRIPVIPECNMEDMEQIVRFLAHFPPKMVELLPYHAMGVSKSLALGEEPFRGCPPSAEEMTALRKKFQKEGVACI